MKYLKLALIVLVSVYAGVLRAGYTIVAHEGAHHVHLVLFETGTPEKVLANVYTDIGTDYLNLGLTGSLTSSTSPLFLANAVARLTQQKIKGLDSDWQSAIDRFAVFIEGYSSFDSEANCQTTVLNDTESVFSVAATHTTMLGDACKTIHCQQSVLRFQSLLEEKLQAQAIRLNIAGFFFGDALSFMGESARGVMGEKETVLDNLGFVYVSDDVTGAEIRDGEIVHVQYANELSPERRAGGFYQLEEELVKECFKSETKPFTAPEGINHPLLKSLLALEVARDFETHEKDLILNRWSQMSHVEIAQAAVFILAAQERPEIADAMDWFNARQFLSELIAKEYPADRKQRSIVQHVANMVELVYSRMVNTEEVTLPVRVMGNFSLYAMGLVFSVREHLSDEISKSVEFVSIGDFNKRQAKAAERLINKTYENIKEK